MGFQKSIRPTRTIYQGGMHLAGACKLPLKWNGCKGKNNTEFCYSGEGTFSRTSLDDNGSYIDFHLNHYFDEVVMETDAKKINRLNEGVLNHVQYRRQYMTASAAAQAIQGEYSTHYFTPAYEALEKRGLVMPIELPEKAQIVKSPEDLTSTWTDLSHLRKLINNAMKIKSSPGKIFLNSYKGSVLSGISLQDIIPSTISTIPIPILITQQQKNEVKKDVLNKQKYIENQSQNLKQKENENEKEKQTKKAAYKPHDAKNKVLTSLPAFAVDKSDLFLGSMIERESDSWSLHLTTFLLNQNKIHNHDTQNSHNTHNTPHVHKVRNDRDTLLSWSQAIIAFNRTAHLNIEGAPNSKYFCRIQASSDSQSYTVPGKLYGYRYTVKHPLSLILSPSNAYRDMYVDNNFSIRLYIIDCELHCTTPHYTTLHFAKII